MARYAYEVNESLLLCIYKGFAISIITDSRTVKVS